MTWKVLHYPVHPRGEVRGFQMTGALIRFSKSRKNDKGNSNLCFCFSVTGHTKTKEEIHFRFSKWCEHKKRKIKFTYIFKVMRKRKTKFQSVFQSDAKTKNEKPNSNPFSKCWDENEKRKPKFKSVFQCHVKTKNEKWTWHVNSSFHAIEKRLALRYTHSDGSPFFDWISTNW